MAEKHTANYLPDGFNSCLVNFVATSSALAEMVLSVAAVREPEKYRDAVDLVKAGRLVPLILARGGTMEVSLLDAATHANIGVVFQYNVPVLEARGVAH